MKIMKKSISLILTMLMLVSCICITDISVSAEGTITPGFYVIGSKEVCGCEWGWSEPWLYNEPMKLSSNGVTYYQVFNNVPSSGGHNTDNGGIDVFEFKVVYSDANGNIAWHPGGMGNNTEVKVEQSGSTILFQFKLLASKPTREGADPEAVIAAVYAPNDDKPADYSKVSYQGVSDSTEEPTEETTDPIIETTDPPVVEETTNPQQETTEPVEETTAPKTGDGIHRPIVSDVVNSKEKVETNSYMFYVPDEWKNEYNNYYEYNPYTKDFTGSGYFAAGIYWWDGVYNCIDNKGSLKSAWSGYAVTETVDENPNIFRADVPKSILHIEWNNLVDDGEDWHNPHYSSSLKTVSIGCDYYDSNDYTYGFYPDGVNSFDGMIYVCDPNSTFCANELWGEIVYKGAWFYYYGNGEYGIYKTREEAEANNGVYKNGKFPKYEGMPEETTSSEVTTSPATEPATTVAPEATTEPPEATTTSPETEETTVSQETGPVEITSAPEAITTPENTPTEPKETATDSPEETTAPEGTTAVTEPEKETKSSENKAHVKKTKKNNSIKVIVNTKTVKLKKLKKGAQNVKALTIRNAKGKVTVKLVKKSSNSKLFKLAKISNKGVITLKKWKKAKKGIYKIKVRITVKGNSKYKAKKITKILKIKIK